MIRIRLPFPAAQGLFEPWPEAQVPNPAPGTPEPAPDRGIPWPRTHPAQSQA